MSARFTASNSTYLANNAAIVTSLPLTIGMWVRPGLLNAAQTIFEIRRHPTSQANSFILRVDSTNEWRMVTGDNFNANGFNIGTVTLNQWAFMLGRFISGTSRRLAVLQYDGSIVHGQDTNSRTPSGLNTSTFGRSNLSPTPSGYFEGNVAEFWITNTDIQPDGAQLQDSTLRQLAYNGPFSLPHIAKDIIEYRSFRSRLDSRADTPEEVYHRGTRQVWTNTNNVQLGPHPPTAESLAYQMMNGFRRTRSGLWMPQYLFEDGGTPPPADAYNTLMLMGWGV